MKKLNKIYKELLSEDLEYAKSDTEGVEDDEFTIGTDTSVVPFNSTIAEGYDMSTLRFNDGKFNKNGANTIFMGDNPILDFGVGEIGQIKVYGNVYNNAMYLQGGYNASEQRRGYGTLGIQFIFSKLPKIEHIILQCVDSAKGFWDKMGAQVIGEKPYGRSEHVLYTMIINRSDSSQNESIDLGKHNADYNDGYDGYSY
jgi:hypothetical protein